MPGNIADDEVIRLVFTAAGLEIPAQAAAEFKKLTEAEQESMRATAALVQQHGSLEVATKAMIGNETSGFAGIAANALKAERAINALVSGRGLARAGGMLESVLGAVGAPAGMGLAFVGVEMLSRVLMPTIEKGFEKLFGESKEQTDALKRIGERFLEMRKEGEKIAARPIEKLEKETAAAFLQRRGEGAEIQEALIDRLQKEEYGATAEEKAKLEWARTHDPAKFDAGFAEEIRELRHKLFEQATNRANDLIAQLTEGNRVAYAEVGRVMGERGREIIRRMEEKIDDAVEKRKQQIFKEDFVGPPTPPPKTPEQRTEAELMQMAQAEDLANQRRRGQAATPQFLKDVVRRAAAAVGEGMDKGAALQQAIEDAQEAQRDRATAEAKRKERAAVRAEMRRQGIQGTPEEEAMVMQHAIRDLPYTAGNITRAVMMGYMQGIHQMRQEAHNMNKTFGNTFQMLGGGW